MQNDGFMESKTEKEKERLRIQQDIEIFIKNGGKIDIIPAIPEKDLNPFK